MDLFGVVNPYRRAGTDTGCGSTLGDQTPGIPTYADVGIPSPAVKEGGHMTRTWNVVAGDLWGM